MLLVTVDGGGTRVKKAVNEAVNWSFILVNTSTSSILIEHTLLCVVRSKDCSTARRKAWISMNII